MGLVAESRLPTASPLEARFRLLLVVRAKIGRIFSHSRILGEIDEKRTGECVALADQQRNPPC